MKKPDGKCFPSLFKNPLVIGGVATCGVFQGFGHTITVCPKTIVYSHRDGNAVSGMDASSR